MPDNEHKPDNRERRLLDEIRRLRANADKGREPEFLAARMGTRQYSVAALLERILAEFEAEYGGNSRALSEAKTESEHLKLILGVTDYIVGVESISISQEDKAEIVRRAYSERFSYGPLDRLFADERITTITLDGPDNAFVRYGHDELKSVGPLFEDDVHLRRVVRRLLVDSGADLSPAQPIIETGLLVGKRRVCVNVAMPPVTFQLSADIRVHPAVLPTLESMVESGFLSRKAASLLVALAESSHGAIIVGDTESGKTTLLAVLASLAPVEQHKAMVAVERAGEMALPDGAARLVVRWQSPNGSPQSFHEQVEKAIDGNPGCILLDEVRTDEPQSVSSLLTIENPPRQMWAFRGPVLSKRLVSALGMLARRSDPSQGESMVRALSQRLPFVITVRRRQGRIELQSIAEWQYSEGSEYPDYVELMHRADGELVVTGVRPYHELPLDEDFWD
jgi:type IV secretory pathway ATPase VirB11/archaellum biosynthesis ATPase